MSAQVRFLGAAGTVTGSRSLIETERAQILIDCGLFQGYKKLRERNWAVPTFEPQALDAVVLTHAHIDHAGYLPRLRKLGFERPIHCTRGTADLLAILLPDSGNLQEEDARRANRDGYTRHRPAEPLYTRREAEETLSQLVTHGFGESFAPADGIAVRFSPAGHILGSASVACLVEGASISFSGDVGRPNDPIMKPPAPVEASEVLVLESTYGDRRHPPEDTPARIATIVTETADRGGTLLVPSFAVGRTQHLLHLLAGLRAAKKIPEIPIFLDSPMAIDATELFFRHREEHRISSEECQAMGRVATYARTPDESKAIDRREGPMIVIAASGMATGGRILHHLQRFLPDERNAVLFVGYQTPGTRGRALLEGADEVKIHGGYARVRAQVAQVEGLSAHADYAELIDWLQASDLSPKKVFVTHGEPAAADAMRRRLKDTFGWDVRVPDDGEAWSFP